ncbi:MAG: WhiB family transcriptional regulator [Acidimicrobiales bacterium]
MRTGWATADEATLSSPTVCRRGGCIAPAGPGGLCERHEHEQLAMRRRFLAAARPRSAVRDFPHAPVVEPVPSWHERAACRGASVELFFPPVEHRGGDYSAARAICASCSVLEPCLRAGLHERYGMWGGLSPPESAALRRRLRDDQERRPRDQQERRPA